MSVSYEEASSQCLYISGVYVGIGYEMRKELSRKEERQIKQCDKTEERIWEGGRV